MVDAAMLYAIKLGPLETGEGPIAAYVGRVAVEKNVEAFLRMPWDGSKIVIGDGPERARLQAHYPGTVFTGFRFAEDLAAHLAAADVMVFPNLVSANLTVKAIMYTAACRFGGILCGTTHPVVFMSRADSTETRLNSLASQVLPHGAARRYSTAMARA